MLQLALLAALSNLAIAVVSAQDPVVFNTSSPLFGGSLTNCGTSGPVSCGQDGDPSEVDRCCYESPGGLLLQTQFWDTRPPIGPSDSWTIHGLWADFCNGKHTANCDRSREYTNIGELLEEAGEDETLAFMKTHWIDNQNRDEHFWEHEWASHGTCYSTLKPSCLPRGSPRGTEAVLFFKRVVELFKKLPTYDWLAQGGITPSETRTHTLSDVLGALKEASGYTPAIECSGKAIQQISWYFYIRGSVIDGEFIPIDAPINSKCAPSGLRYYPKSEQ
jgi:ribonuclease T2